MKVRKTIIFFLLSLTAFSQTPKSYWTFESKSASNSTNFKDSTAFFDLDLASFTGNNYTWETTGASGRSITLTENSKYIIASPSSANVTGSFTYMFCWKPGKKYRGGVIAQSLNNAFAVSFEVNDYVNSSNGMFNIRFFTSTSGGSDNFYINLNGIDRKSFGYYVDGNWHHMAFVYNATTGEKQVWVDWQLPTGFSKTVAPGNPITSGDNTNRFNSNTNYETYSGGLDELAYWTSALSNVMIYQQYLRILNGQHYQYSTSLTSVPSPSPVTAGIDTNDFPITGMTAINQLRLSPVARYKTGNTLHPLFNWVDMTYMGGRFQSGISDAQAAINDTTIQSELIRKWNYMLYVTTNNNEFGIAERALANNYPQYKLGHIIKRAQLSPPTKLKDQTFGANQYFRNGSGQFIDIAGNVTGTKIWTPYATYSNYIQDGNTQKGYLTGLRAALTRPIDIIQENGEVLGAPSSGVLQLDPNCVSSASAAGLPISTWAAKRFAEEEQTSYRNVFMIDFPSTTKYTMYAIDGYPQYRFTWSEARKVNSTFNGMYYSTTDYYPRFPYAWRVTNGAYNGMQWTLTARYNEIATSDKLFSPFVAAGWGENTQTQWIQSVQWGGVLKNLTAMGAEFFYTGFFNEAGSYNPPNPPPADPKYYTYQLMMPSYAQAILSRAEDILRNGDLMNGDVPQYYAIPNGAPGYNFYCGDKRVFPVVRKASTKYYISLSLNPVENMIGQVEDSKNVVFTLDGTDYTINVREQGSTYIYDVTNTSNKIFYQLDGWHENKNPTRWTKDFSYEAELADNTTPRQLKTTYNISSTNLTDYDTYISYNDTTTVLDTNKYVFTPRTDSTYYGWVRLRSRTGASTGVKLILDGGSIFTISGITTNNWYYYRYESTTKVKWVHVDSVAHTLGILPLNKFVEIDKFTLTPDSTLTFPEDTATTPCGTVTAIITPSGATTFCSGNSVTLTATPQTSYLWSTGATTRSINVTTTGTYTVTVTDASGCTGVSTGTAVTVNPTPSTPTITPGGATSFCTGGSVLLTSSSASGNLWSTGAVTQSITASTSGTYTVTVTTGGCSATSTGTVVTVSPIPSVPTITPSGSTTFCSGSSISLTSSVENSYLWSTGATTRSINVSTTGTYTVTVTNTGGCSRTSAGTTVTVNANPSTPTITPSGSTNICQGNSVTLTSSAASSYLWSTGATTNAINVTSSGNYSVTVSNGICTATSSATTVTVTLLPTSTITPSGTVNLCTGQTTSLTASSATSYLWSTGATTRGITVGSSGSYTVTVTSNGCSQASVPTVVNISSSPTPTITSSGSTTFCQGGSVVLTSSAASSYLWSTGATTQSITVLTSGSYSVSVSQGSCSGTSTPTTVTVKTNPVPVISYSGTDPACIGSTVTLSSNYAGGNSWNNGATTQTTSTDTAGNFILTVTQNGCTGTASRVVSFVNCSTSCSTPTGLTDYDVYCYSAYIRWNAVTSATNYVVEVKNTKTGVINETAFGKTPSGRLNKLTAGTRYEIRVYSICGTTGRSEYSTKDSFTTKRICIGNYVIF